MTELLFLSWRHLSRVERICLAALFATLAAWLALPPIAQGQAYHAFADQRALLGLPRSADVLSNAAFALVGLLGIARLAATLVRAREGVRSRRRAIWNATRGLIAGDAL
jgi:hypothetical protein